MFARTVDCHSRLLSNLLIAVHHGGSKLYASWGHTLGESGINMDSGPEYGGDFVSIVNPMLLFFSLRGTLVSPFPLGEVTELLG
jgi:hypothetical protein